MLKWGYNSTSIGDIAKATDTSKATFYHHFKSKEGMLDDVVNYAIENNNRSLLLTLGVELAHQEELRLLTSKIHHLLFQKEFTFVDVGELVHLKLSGENP